MLNILLAAALDVQHLPIETVRAPHTTLTLQIAGNDAQRELGLMNVTRLLPHNGMIFVFDQDATQEFWMKNTLIPLDMIFISADGTVRKVFSNVPVVPVTTPDERIPRRSGDAKFVIELAAGEAAKDGIVPGVRLADVPHAAPEMGIFSPPPAPWQNVRDELAGPNVQGTVIEASYEHIDANGVRHTIVFARTSAAGLSPDEMSAFLQASMRYESPGLTVVNDEPFMACGSPAHYFEVDGVVQMHPLHMAEFITSSGIFTYTSSYVHQQSAQDDPAGLRSIRSLCAPKAQSYPSSPIDFVPPKTFVRAPNDGVRHKWIRGSSNGISILVEGYTRISEFMKIQDYGKSAARQLVARSQTIMESKPVTVCNRPGWYLQTRGNASGKDTVYAQSFMSNGDQLHTIQYIRPALDPDDADAEAALLSSCL